MANPAIRRLRSAGGQHHPNPRRPRRRRAGAGAASAATIPVTTNADALAADGVCSLREAISAANDNVPVGGCPAGETGGTDVVQLGATTYSLSIPGAGGDGNVGGDLDVAGGSAVRVVGAGAAATVVTANGIDRAFDVLSGGALGLQDLTVRDGVGAGSGGGSGRPSGGGGVFAEGSLDVLRVTFAGNVGANGATPDGNGGAIFLLGAGATTIADSLFTGNRAVDGFPAGPQQGALDGGDGGAIFIGRNSSASTVVISGTTFSDNRAGNGGSGSVGAAQEARAGGDGGAIARAGGPVVRIVNSTFAGNRAGDGGANPGGAPGTPGVAGAVRGTGIAIEYSTFSGNRAGTSSAGASAVISSSLAASVIDGPAPACAGVTAPLRNVVLASDLSCPRPSLDVGATLLGPLTANGGPTPTLAPLPGSPAIDALAGAACPATDQRGLPRPQLGGCDAGAVEIQPGAPAAGGPGGGVSAGRRTLSALKIGPSAFRAKGRKPLGTTVSFRLGAAGTVVLTVQKAAPGKKAGKRCVAPRPSLRSAKRCVRKVTLPGKVTRKGIVGPNLIRFSGKLRGRALAPGAYTMVLTLPKAGAAPSVAVTKGFRILA